MSIDIARYGRYPLVHDLVVALNKAEVLAGKPLQVVGGSVMDDSAISKGTILNANSCDWQYNGGDPIGVYIS